MSAKRIEAKINRLHAKYARLEERIGYLMSQRVDVEEALAAAYEERNEQAGKSNATQGS